MNGMSGIYFYMGFYINIIAFTGIRLYQLSKNNKIDEDSKRFST